MQSVEQTKECVGRRGRRSVVPAYVLVLSECYVRFKIKISGIELRRLQRVMHRKGRTFPSVV